MSADNYWDWQETYTGRKIRYDDLEGNVYSIVDIAHALSMQCRFAGHTERFYSVAEHSWHIAKWLQLKGFNPLIQMQGLLHDAAEAYMTDLPRELKVRVPEYKALEQRLETIIFERFSVPLPLHPFIKIADQRILVNEREALFTGPEHRNWSGGVPLAETEIEGWPPETAKAMFLRRFFYLTDLANTWFKEEAKKSV